MTQSAHRSCVAFDGHTLIGSGPLVGVALVVKRAIEAGAGGPVLIFDDGDGRVIDIDTRGTDAQIIERLSPAAEADMAPPQPRGRGRPKLGVVAREVTLLPRHWDWLAAQPGGASAAVRRLVEEARRVHADRDRARQTRDAAYRVMAALAGDLPGFEEASRALFANDRAKFTVQVGGWPADVRNYVVRLAFGEMGSGE